MNKILLAGAAMVLVGAGSASAADIYPAPVIEAPVIDAPVYETPVHQPVAAASGWYLRGDAGYAWNRTEKPTFFQGDLNTYVPFTTASLRSSYSVGGGVGYQINSKLRSDVTLDYFSIADFRGSTTGGCGVLPAGPCTSTDISGVSGLSLLANAYVDFYKSGRYTLYGGAGIGGTYVRWDDLSNTSCSSANPALCDPTEIHRGVEGWRFTYALMAGASVDLTCKLKADVGYRYRNVASGAMFMSLNSNGTQGYHKNMASHEVRGGLRYSLGAGDCAQEEVYIEPAPIMPAVYK
ncbi:outer membrane protein [Hoeflea ulvae]|uniref:Porin family protein n=1 Tax=Hoeflea ulvae TaxID=2983764 RepID=A0ABT3YKL3_9HYPH|nr:outer membrane protein [Hoeflea ulvae]MCY0096446.1 porin family protein [Hoeflea ulvae]